MFTIAPPPASRSSGIAAEAMSAGPATLTPRLRAQSAADASSPSARKVAAQFTRKRTGPPSLRAAATAAWRVDSSWMSPTTPETAPASSELTSPTRLASRSTITIRVPASRNARTVARPIPEAPPVTIATAPVNSLIFITSMFSGALSLPLGVKRQRNRAVLARRAVHRLGKLHVAKTLLEVRGHRGAVSNRVDEVGLSGPLADELGWNLQRCELLVTATRARDLVGGDLVHQGAFTPVQLDPVLAAEIRSAAEMKDSQGAIAERSDDAEAVGYIDGNLLNRANLATARYVVGGQRGDLAEIADPAVNDLGQHSNVQGVVSRDKRILPPVQGKRGIREGAGQTVDVHLA